MEFMSKWNNLYWDRCKRKLSGTDKKQKKMEGEVMTFNRPS